MAMAEIKGVLSDPLCKSIKGCKVLVVGAGGIGCELLKNLVLSGFPDIHIIDLDTIEVSNLNRQFLFRREHVGRPKAVVAKESALLFNSNVKITTYHDSITEEKFNVNFYQQFMVILNALDNRGARSHVNRMCLAANKPLVESGSSGFKGHVALYKKGVSECFDCIARPHQKTYPGCTIRSTPSEPIHCIVWAKHLFNQLFGRADPDEDVSPDSAHPEAVGNAGNAALEKADEEKVSTRQWAIGHQYDASKLFQKLFHDDIRYLLSMENLWQTRRPPTPLDLTNLPDAIASSSSSVPSANLGLKDQRIWTIAECWSIFKDSVNSLKERVTPEKSLLWDKDDDGAMDFVTTCSNIRCHIFGIKQMSRFDTKSMAGNIIPAIASTNAIVAGLIVTTVFNALAEEYHKCNTLYLSERLNVHKQLFTVDRISAPNPNCYVCKDNPELTLKVNFEKVTVRFLADRILKHELDMIDPEVQIDDGKGTILIYSDMDDALRNKLVKELKVTDGTRLKCDDFLQNYQLNITMIGMKEMAGNERVRDKDDVSLFEIIGDRSMLHPKEQVSTNNNAPSTSNNGGTTAMNTNAEDDDQDLIMMIEPEFEEMNVFGEDVGSTAAATTKAKRLHTGFATNLPKRRRLEDSSATNNLEVVELM